MAQIPSLTPALKRKRSDDESPTPTTPTRGDLKRPKVSFSETNKVRYIESKNEKPLSLIQEDIRVALARHRQKDDALYRKLKDLFTTDPYDDDAPSNSLMRQHIVALSSQTLSFSNDSGDLVHSILCCDWLQRDEDFYLSFRHFLAALLLTHSGYITLTLKWLVGHFAGVKLLTLPNIAPVDEDQIFERLHDTLRYVLIVIPQSRGIIEPMLEAFFPHHTSDAKHFIKYVNGLLKIDEYSPHLTPGILQTIVDKTLGIDVQVGVDVDPLEEDELSHLVNLVRQGIDDLTPLEPPAEDSEPEDEIDLGSDTMQLKRMKEAMMKLDSALDALFQFYQSRLDNQSPPDVLNTFRQLISMFTRTILTTHNSRHIQYLLFRFSQLDSSIYNLFIEALFKQAFDRNTALPIRCSAISYVACFAARGAKLDDEAVRSLFDRLSIELQKLRKGYEGKTMGPDSERFRFYYNMFQSLMYIFCFRWKSFVKEPQEDESDDGYQWIAGVKEMFDQNCLSKLNPLKVCSPILVEMFAKITHHLNFLYLFSKLESNKRIRLVRSVQFAIMTRESALNENHSESALQLANQYAFEPYVLPCSKRWIKDMYISFDDVCPPGMEDDDEDEDDEDESSAEE